MNSAADPQDFSILGDFLCEYHYLMFEKPFCGDLRTFQVVFGIFHEKTTGKSSPERSLADFAAYLDTYNEMSGYSLEIKGETLQSVNIHKVQLLQGKKPDFAALKPPKARGTLTPKQQLAKLLEPEKNGVDINLQLLEPQAHFSNDTFHHYMNYESACVALNKQRARLATVKKPFFQVCNNANHNKVLSNVCLSRKDFNHGSKQTFPSWAQCLQAIDQYQKLFSAEVYRCTRTKIHYLPIITNYTDVALGDCSYLDTCHKMKTCRYLHYFSLYPKLDKSKVEDNKDKLYELGYTFGQCFTENYRKVLGAQWINCDVRYLPFSVLGKFSAILSDPAWDIHMALPYGTCKDMELMSLPMHQLQDEGIMLLWVTGRSIDVGRQALNKWGYRVSDEVIWVKLNQLKRTIVTGRTGHWLNHSKEHLLVGVKGSPEWLGRGVDVNVVVSGTRETSRKPDEVYDLVERLVGPYARKLEIFGRDHNVRPGWLTIGNQLSGTNLLEKDVKQRYQEYKRLKSEK